MYLGHTSEGVGILDMFLGSPDQFTSFKDTQNPCRSLYLAGMRAYVVDKLMKSF